MACEGTASQDAKLTIHVLWSNEEGSRTGDCNAVVGFRRAGFGLGNDVALLEAPWRLGRTREQSLVNGVIELVGGGAQGLGMLQQ